jgi:hypothetical protein
MLRVIQKVCHSQNVNYLTPLFVTQKYNRSIVLEVTIFGTPSMHLKIAHDIAGVPPPPQRRTYRDLNTRIALITRDYGNRNIINFLRAISYNIA